MTNDTRQTVEQSIIKQSLINAGYDIEIVARAICRAGICGPKAHLDEQENLHWRKYELEAKAAIAALSSKPQDDDIRIHVCKDCRKKQHMVEIESKTIDGAKTALIYPGDKKVVSEPTHWMPLPHKL